METIRYEPCGPIARISLDDGKANAMSVPFFSAFGEALDRAERDSRAVVISGRAGMFSGGLDLKLIPTLAPADLRALAREFARTMLRVFTLPLPTVAALTGHAIAGGAILALACDRRVAANGPFKLRINEVAIGIPMPTWMITVAAAAIPLEHQVSAMLHAHAYSPEDARACGIVQRVCAPGEDVVTAAVEAASDLQMLEPRAYAETKRRMRAAKVAHALSVLEGELPR